MNSKARERTFALITVSLAVFVCLLIAEGILRVMEKLPQKLYLDYGDAVDQGYNPGGLFRKNFDEEVIDFYGHPVRMKTNSVGFRNDREFDPEPEAGATRILSIGDSFGGGYRLGQDQTYTYLLEKELNAYGLQVEMPLALVDDPNSALSYMRRSGLGYHPNAVLQGITLGNDFLTVTAGVSGVWEHISTLKLTPECQIPKTWWNETKWWANYGRFHVRVARLILQPNRAIASYMGQYREPLVMDGLHGLGLFMKNPPAEVEQAYRDLFGILKQYNEEMKKNKVPVWFVIFPQRFQIHEEDWQAAITEYMLKPDCFDLEKPNRRIREFCEKEGMTCIDPTARMQEQAQTDGKKLYFPRGDMHWNPDGNRALALAILNPLREKIKNLKSGH